MTTESVRRFTSDVFAEGGEVFLPRPDDGAKARIAAISFVRDVTDNLRSTRRECLGDALRWLLGSPPPVTQARLLIGASRWLPDGVRVRAMSKLTDPGLKRAFSGRDWLEVLMVGAEGVKWVADLPVDLSTLEAAESLMFEYPYSAIVGGATDGVVHHFLQHGWSRSDEWFRAADSRTQFLRDTVLIGQLEGLTVIRLFGAFDDRVASADIIGSASRIEELWRNEPTSS